MKPSFELHRGDALDVLRTLPAASVQCAVTSPPYWGLRDYGVAGQLGVERTPEEYVGRMVEVFREVRRVLRADGTLWLNLGDSYVTNPGNGRGGEPGLAGKGGRGPHRSGMPRASRAAGGLKPKDLAGIPWRVALALQADGWYLRSDIIWHKPNPMPEPVRDRPTRGHEYLFLLAKSGRYYFDAAAVAEPAVEPRYRSGHVRRAPDAYHAADGVRGRYRAGLHAMEGGRATRNVRTVWTIAPASYRGAHFAVFPPQLVRPCVLAGSRPGDSVIDPFCGSGTTGVVAEGLRRRFIGIDLNPAYLDLARERIRPAGRG